MPPHQKSILCLCHDATTLQVRKLLLEHFGYEVLATSSIEHARELASELCPDLLLMDNHHPAVSCEDVAAEMKVLCPAILTVVLSPYFSARPVGDGSVDRFISDDETPDCLVAHLHELLSEADHTSAADARGMV